MPPVKQDEMFRGLDPRPRWSRETYFEGDLRTWYVSDESLAPSSTTDDLWDVIPTAVKNEIAEVLELYLFTNSTAVWFILDGARLPPQMVYNGGLFIPIHKPKVSLQFLNTSAEITPVYAWGIRYRRKVQERE